MKVASIKGEGGRRLKAVKFNRLDAIYWLLPQDARIAENWASRPEGATGDVTLSAFIQKNAVRRDEYRGPPPAAPDAEPEQAASTIERGWHCGNGQLRAQVTLRLIAENRVSCCAAMETLAGLAQDAGPAFCRSMLLTHDQMDIPF